MNLEEERLALRALIARENHPNVELEIEKYRRNASLVQDKMHMAHADFYAGRSKIETGEYNKALQLLKRSISFYEKNESLLFLQASYVAVGIICYNLGNFEEALQYYDSAANVPCEFNQYNASALINKSKLLLEFKQYDKAIAASRLALKHLSLNVASERSFYFQALLNLSSIYAANNQDEKAKMILEKIENALKVHPSKLIEARLERNLGNYYSKLANCELAMHHYNKGLELCREQNYIMIELEIQTNKGLCLLQTLHYDEAKECLEAAYLNMPRNNKMQFKNLLFALINLYDILEDSKHKKDKEDELELLLTY
ncbi:MAG: hypothetical protein H6579_08965 [Chitinophagales bacterium]|nr:hypothetical protein [Chitinophagales bacterium]